MTNETNNIELNAYKKLQRKSFTPILYSYFLIILVVILINIFVFNKLQAEIKENAENVNISLLNQVVTEMDFIYDQVQRISNRIVFNKNIGILLSGYDDAYSIYDFYKEISGLNPDLIFDLYILNMAENEVITPTGRMNAEMFYKNISYYTNVSYNDWRNSLSKYYKSSIQQINSVTYLTSTLLTNQHNVFTYIQSIPIEKTAPLKAQLVILFEDKTLKNVISNITKTNDSTIYIFDESNKQIYPADIMSSELYSQISNTNNETLYKEVQINNATHVVAKTKSTKTNFCFVSVTPKSEFYVGVNESLFLIIFSTLICITIGTILSWLFANKNYKPIREISKYITDSLNIDFSKNSTELEYIKNTLVHSVDKFSILEDKLNSSAPYVRSAYLTQLLKGEPSAIKKYQQNSKLFDITFRSDIFAVIIVRIYESSNFFENKEEIEWGLARFAVANSGEEIIREKYDCHWLSFESDSVTFIVSLKDKNQDVQMYEEDISILVESLFNTITEACQLELTIASSSVRKGVDQIPLCNDEAQKAISHSSVYGKNKIIKFEDVTSSGSGYYYPYEIEIQILNGIKTNDKQGVHEKIDFIFNSNFKNKKMSVNSLNCLTVDILCTFIRAIDAGNKNDLIHDISIDKFYSRVSTCKSFESTIITIKNISDSVCDYISENKQDTSVVIANKVAAYVNENYTDSSLSLNSIAEALNLSPQYISTIFKRVKGDNLKDYIALKRLELAKELLKNDSVSLSDISEQVGFNNDISIIRLFKKYLGKTPSEYRKDL